MWIAAAVGLIDDMVATTVLAGIAQWMEGADPYRVHLPAQLPVRIGWGARDRTLPYDHYGAPWRELLPGADHVELPGCGHVPMYDDPALVADTILAVTAPRRG